MSSQNLFLQLDMIYYLVPMSILVYLTKPPRITSFSTKRLICVFLTYLRVHFDLFFIFRNIIFTPMAWLAISGQYMY